MLKGKKRLRSLAAEALSDHRHHPVHAVASVRTGCTVLNGSHNAENYAERMPRSH